MNIVLGITGGIAAYKAVELLRIFKTNSHDVRVVLTPHALEFVQPLTLQTLSGHPVRTSLFSADEESKISHIELAQNSDAILVVPATANIISKVACGLCGDLLSTILCAANVPVIFSPSMNTVMWENPIIQENITRLQNRGFHFIEPDSGYLACDTIGKGRIPNPQQIYDDVIELLTKKLKLSGKRILITAGPTIEPIDKFRYISNYSTGKMGYALAGQASLAGADVTLISGPVSILPPPTKRFIPVNTAQEMFDAVVSQFDEADIIIKTAAVVDYAPKNFLDGKMKKNLPETSLEMKLNSDILKHIGALKRKKQYIVGFAAETDNLVKNAREKLISKNADLIIGNYIGVENSGFASDTNKIMIVSKTTEQPYEGTKMQLAKIILAEICKNIGKLNT